MIKMKLPKRLDEYLDYLNDNMILVMKAILIFAFPVAGGIIAVFLRREGFNYLEIITTGIIFEIIGITLFILFIINDYKKFSRTIASSEKSK